MKRVIALLLSLVMIFTILVLAGCKKNEEVTTDDINTDSAITDGDEEQEVFLTLYALGDEEQEYKFSFRADDIQQETGMLFAPARSGEKIGDALKASGYSDIAPIENVGKFEGWMEYKEATSVDADGFEQFAYEKLSGDTLYTTEQLLKRPMPDYSVMYVAKWDNLDYDYYAMMGF